MAALKKAMRWDEQRFGLEYDLDLYMIVAVGDFNMGAMENKGLNIFNTKYVLARPDTATDADYQGIDRVVAHEYFHNWTGNRVTCRDWFQLSLKEGLTVFRDQEFGADTHSRAVTRIQEVRGLRVGQFPEDAGPMAHPIRPASYAEINNFYTATVYNKGAEVIRMMHTLLGRDGFRRGMDLYFERHDGQAVTCDDFVAAMQDATGVDLDTVPPLVRARRHAAPACRGRVRRRDPALHADAHPTPRAHRLRKAPGRIGAAHRRGRAAYSRRARAGVARRPRRATATRRRDRGRRHHARAVAHRTQPDLRLRSHSRRARRLAAARFLRAGAARTGPDRRRTRAPDGARFRRLQPLGSRAAAGDARPARRHRGGRRRQRLDSRRLRRRLRPRARRRFDAATRRSPPKRSTCPPKPCSPKPWSHKAAPSTPKPSTPRA